MALLAPGDLVRTPTGRTAVVADLRADGRRDLIYTDSEGGEGVLHPTCLVLVKKAPPKPWKSRRPV